MIVAAIEGSDHHISAEEIHNQIEARYPHLNISTIYRPLDLLKRRGLVTETDLGERSVRYHSAERWHYHHLVCQRCGQIIDLDEASLFFVNYPVPRAQGVLEPYQDYRNSSLWSLPQG